MTIEEIKSLGFEELEKRSAEIAEEAATADETQLEELNKELDSIESRKKVLTIEVEETRKKVGTFVSSYGGVQNVQAWPVDCDWFGFLRKE